MLWPSLIAGFSLGFAGSLHCVGMCGPLSLALPTYQLSGIAKFLTLLLYQFGRIITYSILGLLAGFAGRLIFIAGIQQWFSIAAGFAILILAACYFIQKYSIRIPFFNRFYISVQTLIIQILKQRKGPAGFLLLGMANGLLPCGMVYIALATSLSLTQLSHSIGFMSLFGAGTLPAMMLIGYGGQFIKPGMRVAFRKLTPFFITGAGIVLILRGLNLGILFISPQLPQAGGPAILCHP